MPIKLYDPSTREFATYTTVPDSALPSLAMINLNILIELRLLTTYLAAMNIGVVSDDPQELREDMVKDGVY